MPRGYLEDGETSEELQKLKIISDEESARIDEILEQRSKKDEDKRRIARTTKGKALLSGNIFCGHCGARLCITTSGRNRRLADGSRGIRTRYTCQTKSRTHGDCDGQTGYTVEKLDAIIDSVIHGIFSRV